MKSKLAQQLVAELTHEAKATRALLQVVPMDKLDYKPHPKSMTLGRLAVHVAEISGWVKETILLDELDFAKMDFKPFEPKTNDELLAFFDKLIKTAQDILNNATDDDFEKPWTMRTGDQIYFTMPKGIVARTWCFNHMVHHRAQLGVYLRLLDVAIPSTYGPTADSKG